jgi:hypothetical protein
MVLFVAGGTFTLVGSGPAVGSLPMRPTPLSAVASLSLAAVVVVALRSVRGPLNVTDAEEKRPSPWCMAVPAACLLLAAFSPHYFDSIAREDGAVEWVGAIATGCGCIWLLVAARRSVAWQRALLLVAAAVLFVLTGEELSWLQRIGEFGTPEALSGNGQGEANLHNLATDRVQALYYLATSAALVALPFLARWTPFVPSRVRDLAPGPSVVVVAASSTAFAYARTGNLAHHITFWVAVGALAWWSLSPRPTWVFAALALVVGGQALMWVVGPDLTRPWAPDEYREMLLGVALALWARQMLVATRWAGARIDDAAQVEPARWA